MLILTDGKKKRICTDQGLSVQSYLLSAHCFLVVYCVVPSSKDHFHIVRFLLFSSHQSVSETFTRSVKICKNVQFMWRQESKVNLLRAAIAFDHIFQFSVLQARDPIERSSLTLIMQFKQETGVMCGMFFWYILIFEKLYFCILT